MRIEVDCNWLGTTRSVLKWIAVGVAYMWLCLRSFFVRKKLLSSFLSIFCAADGWTTKETRALVSISFVLNARTKLISNFLT